ncbi:MAG: hypothetical protein ACRD5Z_09465 [Bryobacteraceae bacterium]
MALCAGGCADHSHRQADADSDDVINTVPKNYKADILAAMHAYFNDPTGIRDAAIAEPALKSVGGPTRYVVCVRFNAKLHGTTYAGVRDFAAVFVAGRFDRFVETPREQCAAAAYAPFPELEKLSR